MSLLRREWAQQTPHGRGDGRSRGVLFAFLRARRGTGCYRSAPGDPTARAGPPGHIRVLHGPPQGGAQESYGAVKAQLPFAFRFDSFTSLRGVVLLNSVVLKSTAMLSSPAFASPVVVSVSPAALAKWEKAALLLGTLWRKWRTALHGPRRL